MRFTPPKITALQPGEVFVFGSNDLGRHGAGAAHDAIAFGAKPGQGFGPSGQTYAIATRMWRRRENKAGDVELFLVDCDIHFVMAQVHGFLAYALGRDEATFLVTEIGTGRAGFTHAQIAHLFVGGLGVLRQPFIPRNIILPETFYNLMREEQPALDYRHD